MNNNKPDKQLYRRKFSPQFKDQALERIAKDAVRQVAKDLGLSEPLLYSRKAQQKKGGSVLREGIKVVGWALSERMTKQLVIDALQMAIWARRPPKRLILHSDRGSQYCSDEYQQLLMLHGLVCSMSKRGDCYDNAAMESWNHSFKVETVHGEKFATRAIAQNQVFEYIDIYYNRKRLHSMIGYKSAEFFEVKKVA